MQDSTLAQLADAAVRCHAAGRLREAEALYRQLLVTRPHEPDVHYNLGCALQEMGRLPEALLAYEAAAMLRPGYAEAHGNRGMVLHRLGRLDEAAGAFTRAAAIRPDYADAHYHLGRVLEDLGRDGEAIRAYQRAVSLGPHGLSANRGSALRKLGRLDEAVAAFQDAIRLRESADLRLNLGAAYQEQGEPERAIAEYRRAIELRPEFAEAYTSLASALRELGRVDDAMAACERAIRIRPDYAEAAWNLGLLKLLKGQFAQGWELYEARLRLNRTAGCLASDTSAPLTASDFDVRRRRVLLVAEQGFGDAIQFVRYAPIVAQVAEKVILRCQRELKRLFHSSLPNISVVADVDPTPECDVCIPLMSLPRLLGTRADNIPAAVPYLRPDAELVRAWREKMSTDGAQKIGLAWAGRRANSKQRVRAMEPAELAVLRDMSAVKFFSLQKHERGAVPALPPLDLIDLTGELHDFAETAALIANLDLVISVDTALAHLAGALGKPVWLVLPFAADWRWMLDRADSPWYPGMRLFRQPRPGDWQSPLRQIAQELGAGLVQL